MNVYVDLHSPPIPRSTHSFTQQTLTLATSGNTIGSLPPRTIRTYWTRKFQPQCSVETHIAGLPDCYGDPKSISRRVDQARKDILKQTGPGK